jgi:surface antigen
MNTTLFGKKLIEAAESVLQIEYRAGENNRFGEKLEQVVREFDAAGNTKLFAGVGRRQPDYCGITVSVIIDRAMREYNGEANAYRSASAKWFKDNAKKFGLRIDKTPRNGCLFLTKRSGGSGYHIGFVWEVINNGTAIKTIEGNTWSGSSFHVRKTGCKIKLVANEYGILSRARPVKNIDSFIHIEEMFNDLIAEFPKSDAMLADSTVTPANTDSMLADIDYFSGQSCSFDDYDVDAEGGEDVNVAGNFLGFIPEEYRTYVYIGGGIFLAACIGTVIANLPKDNKKTKKKR